MNPAHHEDEIHTEIEDIPSYKKTVLFHTPSHAPFPSTTPTERERRA